MIQSFFPFGGRRTNEDEAQTPSPVTPQMEDEEPLNAWGAPSSPMHLYLTLMRMGLDAPSVVAMRTMSAAGFWNASPSESSLMIREKQEAFAKGAAAATLAMMRGSSPATIMLEAIKPAGVTTGSNARRLSEIGPKIPGRSGTFGQ
ncbi:MAG: hypothetical protein AAF590_05720 [Pseudomonadota bacterium]